MRLISILAGALMLALTACASTDGTGGDELHPSVTIATKLGVQIGVLQYVGEDAEKAARVRAAVDVVSAVLTDDPDITLTELQGVVDDIFEAAGDRLTPQQSLLLRQSVTLVISDLGLLIPDDVLSDDVKDRVLFYLDAVSEAMGLVIEAETEQPGA